MFIDYEGDKSVVHSTRGVGETFATVLDRRLHRRGLLRSAAGAGMAAATLAVTGPRLVGIASATEATRRVGALGFAPITLDTGPEPVVAEGHRITPFLRWGDPVVPDAPAFDPANQTPAAQARQAGYNCDWIGFLPLPEGSDSSDHGLLVVNHEYTNPELMFPDYLVANPAFVAGDEELDEPEFLPAPTKEHVDVELEAHGLTVVEIERDAAGAWQIVLDSPYNRRITGTTIAEISGPAAGADLLKTAEDETGTRVIGTLNNCAGGITPWGTIISGEENFHQYFGMLSGLDPEDPTYENHVRYGLPEESSERRWAEFYDRFNIAETPNEPLRFGWGVELDPYDPESTPRKLTALGRNKHEGHTSVVAPGGQVVVYSGDDGRFEYAYKFVTEGTYNPNDRAANLGLLDAGTLYVARFNDDGTGDWLPLVHDVGPLTADNGFASQADVLVNTRAAADAVGATKMDRPEDFEANPVTGKVYLVLTNNNARTLDTTDRANPRTENLHGHIIELTEAGDDHASTSFTWEMFLLAGDPAQGATWFAGFASDEVSPFSAPDNITFDRDGNMWISTDGMPSNLPGNDGIFVVPTEGEARGQVHQFFSAVPGSEVSGPIFTPDNAALFVSIQHPGEGGTYAAPLTRWPDGGEMPPRPSVIVIERASTGLTTPTT
jgi:secreted PhoX family phosphatase